MNLPNLLLPILPNLPNDIGLSSIRCNTADGGIEVYEKKKRSHSGLIADSHRLKINHNILLNTSKYDIYP